MGFSSLLYQQGVHKQLWATYLLAKCYASLPHVSCYTSRNSTARNATYTLRKCNHNIESRATVLGLTYTPQQKKGILKFNFKYLDMYIKLVMLCGTKRCRNQLPIEEM